MICKACMIAGDISKFIKDRNIFVNKLTKLTDAAVLMHKECLGGGRGCDCGHRVNDYSSSAVHIKELETNDNELPGMWSTSDYTGGRP